MLTPDEARRLGGKHNSAKQTLACRAVEQTLAS